MKNSKFKIKNGGSALLLLFSFFIFHFSLSAADGPLYRENYHAAPGGVSTPNIITMTNGVIAQVFSQNYNKGDGRVLKRVIQNTGTNAVFYAVGSPSITTVSGASFHGILAGGASPRDGLGSSVDLSWTTTPVYLICTNLASEICTIELTQ